MSEENASKSTGGWLERFEKDMNIISKLDDEPNSVGGLTAAELKEKFDESGVAIQDYINNLLLPRLELEFDHPYSDLVIGNNIDSGLDGVTNVSELTVYNGDLTDVIWRSYDGEATEILFVDFTAKDNARVSMLSAAWVHVEQTLDGYPELAEIGFPRESGKHMFVLVCKWDSDAETFVIHDFRFEDLGGAGGVDEEQLQEAIEQALEQAKESGEFDGPPGKDGKDGQNGQDGQAGQDGKDGVSPTVATSSISGGHRVTITDINGTKYFDVKNGQNGSPGKDGSSGKDGVGVQSIVQTTTSNQDGGQNVITVTLTNGNKSTFRVKNGGKGSQGDPGEDGKDGTSVTHSWNGTTLTIKSASGSSSANLQGPAGLDGKNGADGQPGKDGANGSPGQDGVSPVVSVSAIVGGNKVTITDASGSKNFNVMNGADGAPGKDGQNGSPGSDGKNGTSATHSWNGTVLTITSASGTSSADLKGEKGDAGDDGQTGPTGETGRRGSGLLPVTTAPSAYTTAVNGLTPAYRIALNTVKTQASTDDVYAGDTIRHSYYHYPIIYVDSSYVYCGTRVSIRGATGSAGKTPVKGTDYYTDADKTEMVGLVKSAMPTLTVTGVDGDGVTHTWTMYGTKTS